MANLPKLPAVNLSRRSRVHKLLRPCPRVDFSMNVWRSLSVLEIKFYTSETSLVAISHRNLCHNSADFLENSSPDTSWTFHLSSRIYFLNMINDWLDCIQISLPIKVEQPRKHMNVPEVLVLVNHLIVKLCWRPHDKVANFSPRNIE